MMKSEVRSPKLETVNRRDGHSAHEAPDALSPSQRLGVSAFRQPHRLAFTLIELILVMAMLSIVLALASPSLARFFRGRGLDSEAKRFLALTRYAQSRAVSEGVPMLLWIDEDQRVYGLQAEQSYVEQDAQAVEYGLGSNLVVEVELPLANVLAGRMNQWQAAQIPANLPTLRFGPDGFVNETSPERIVIRQIREGEEDAVLIGLNPLRLNYEILTNEPPILRR